MPYCQYVAKDIPRHEIPIDKRSGSKFCCDDHKSAYHRMIYQTGRRALGKGLGALLPGFSEQDKKHHGMGLAAESNAEILRIFRVHAQFLADKFGQVDIDLVRASVEIDNIKFTSGAWMGSVFTESKWVCVGFKPATHAGSRGRIVRTWKLK